MGFSGAGRLPLYSNKAFQFYGFEVSETLANLGVLYYVFIIGLESDVSMISRVGKRGLGISMSGIIVPPAVGFGLFSFMQKLRPDVDDRGAIFWALALTVTSFPDLARVLADRKLLYTEIGKTAISAGVSSDIFTWILLAITILVLNNGIARALVISVILVPTCIFVVRPLIKRFTKDSKGGGLYKSEHLCTVLASISFFSFVSDALGMQPFVGAFVFGLMIPNGELKRMLLEKLRNIVSGFLFPLYFFTLVLKLKFKFLLTDISPGVLATIIVLACLAKIMSTFLVSIFQKMSAQESLALGLLSNTKGFLALIVLDAGRDMKVYNNSHYFSFVGFDFILVSSS